MLGYSRNSCGNSQTVKNKFCPALRFHFQYMILHRTHQETHLFQVMMSRVHYQLMTVSSWRTILLVDGDAPSEQAACPCALSGSKWISAGRSRSRHDSVHTFLMASSQNKSPVCFLIWREVVVLPLPRTGFLWSWGLKLMLHVAFFHCLNTVYIFCFWTFLPQYLMYIVA